MWFANVIFVVVEILMVWDALAHLPTPKKRWEKKKFVKKSMEDVFIDYKIEFYENGMKKNWRKMK